MSVNSNTDSSNASKSTASHCNSDSSPLSMDERIELFLEANLVASLIDEDESRRDCGSEVASADGLLLDALSSADGVGGGGGSGGGVTSGRQRRRATYDLGSGAAASPPSWLLDEPAQDLNRTFCLVGLSDEDSHSLHRPAAPSARHSASSRSSYATAKSSLSPMQRLMEFGEMDDKNADDDDGEASSDAGTVSQSPPLPPPPLPPPPPLDDESDEADCTLVPQSLSKLIPPSPSTVNSSSTSVGPTGLRRLSHNLIVQRQKLGESSPWSAETGSVSLQKPQYEASANLLNNQPSPHAFGHEAQNSDTQPDCSEVQLHGLEDQSLNLDETQVLSSAENHLQEQKYHVAEDFGNQNLEDLSQNSENQLQNPDNQPQSPGNHPQDPENQSHVTEIWSSNQETRSEFSTEHQFNYAKEYPSEDSQTKLEVDLPAQNSEAHPRVQLAQPHDPENRIENRSRLVTESRGLTAPLSSCLPPPLQATVPPTKKEARPSMLAPLQTVSLHQRASAVPQKPPHQATASLPLPNSRLRPPVQTSQQPLSSGLRPPSLLQPVGRLSRLPGPPAGLAASSLARPSGLRRPTFMPPPPR